MISDWTSLKWQIWRQKVLENGTKAVIGQTMERNVARFGCDQPFLWGEHCVTSQKTAAKETILFLSWQLFVSISLPMLKHSKGLLTGTIFRFNSYCLHISFPEQKQNYTYITSHYACPTWPGFDMIGQ